MRSPALSLSLLAGCFSVAAAQQNLYLVNEQNLNLLCDINNPGFFIGNNPSVIALSDDRLFVGGYNNSPSAVTVRSIVKIENIFGARAFRLLNTNPDPLGAPSNDTTLQSFRGYYGLTYAPNAGLLASYDNAGVGTRGAFRLYDVDTQLNPILLSESPAGISPRGGAGTAWDFGFDGQGFDLDADTIQDGPVVGLLDFSSYPGNVQALGPFGVRSRESAVGAGDALTAIGNGRIYDGSSVDGSGNPIAPVLNGTDSAGNRINGTIWRDLAVHPQNGNVAARASNDLVLGIRNSLNGLSSHVVLDLSPGTGDPYAFQIMQRCEILSGLPGGDVVVFNDYSAPGNSLATWTRFVDFSGQAADVNLLNADGSPFDVASASAIFDYSWDAANSRLAICSFALRRVYIFSTQPPTPPCPWAADGCYADFNNDDGIDGDDVIAFFADWDGSLSCADADGSEGVDGDDVIVFFAAWDVSGTGFPGC